MLLSRNRIMNPNVLPVTWPDSLYENWCYSADGLYQVPPNPYLNAELSILNGIQSCTEKAIEYSSWVHSSEFVMAETPTQQDGVYFMRDTHFLCSFVLWEELEHTAWWALGINHFIKQPSEMNLLLAQLDTLREREKLHLINSSSHLNCEVRTNWDMLILLAGTQCMGLLVSKCHPAVSQSVCVPLSCDSPTSMSVH